MNLRKTILISFAFSGAASLIYEVTWIRPLQFLLGSTTYILAIIFGAFMAGLALGAFVIAKHVDRIKNLPKTYALLELGIGIYGVLLLSIFNLLPQLYNVLYGLHTNFYLFQIVQFLLVFVVLIIPTTLMGATFPIVAKVYTKEKIGKAIGEVYGANTLGAIIGSFAAGFILIPLIGIKASIITAGILNLAIGSYILIKSDKNFNKFFILSAILIFLILGVYGNYNIQKMHSGGFYRTSEIQENLGQVLYYKEGIYATVSVREIFGAGKALFINGKGQGSTEISDLRVNFLLSYLPELIKPEAEKALVIGLGTGTTSGQLSQIKQVTTVEIEKAMIPASEYFKTFNANVLENPNHRLIIADGRNYLLKNSEKYDIIIPEPSDPWQSFSTALFSKEFLYIAKEDLNEDGLFLQWVPIYQMSPEDFKSFYATFNSVFPNTVAFANIKPTEDTPIRFETSELILVGSKKEIDLENFNSNYNALPEESKLLLSAIRLESGDKVSDLFLFDSDTIKGYAQSASLITDDKPTLEFSTAKNVLTQDPKLVLEDINKYLEGRNRV